MESNYYKIGIDVGGTNTDVVILNQNNEVVTSIKTPTTSDIQNGIHNGIEKVLIESNIDLSAISYVSLGTTQATNAIIRRRDLAKVAIVRICLPAGKGVKPLSEWEKDLVTAIDGNAYLIHGGSEYDGRPLAGENLEREECLKVLEQIKASQADAIAVSSIFSPVRSDHEKEFAELAKEVLGSAFPITLSSEIGSIGLLERENSTVLNASVVAVAYKAAKGLIDALSELGIESKVFFAQNDGTLMALDYAIRYPVLTIGSGPTNSIRGAAYLSRLEDCIVVDIGGTSTDVGILSNGFPRQSSVSVEVGGVLTNFRMPDLISIGLGGGSIISFNGDKVTIGPDSVGYEIKDKAICFGGNVLTVTDIAIASGVAVIDDHNCDPSRLSHFDQSKVRQAMDKIVQMVTDACDRIKTSFKPLPVILVGGGSIIMPKEVQGIDKLIRPENFGCANAIGAAIADASGEVDALFTMEGKSREEVIQQAKHEAIQKAVEMGATPEETSVVDMEVVPLSYLPGNVIRVKVKAAGPLRF